MNNKDRESMGIFMNFGKALYWPFPVQNFPVEKEVVCSIDDEQVECSELGDTPFTGIPAPRVLDDDHWFGSAVISDANKDYMELEFQAFKEEAHRHYKTKEPDNIHEVMYEMATKNAPTTLQLDPPTAGGSENFQEGWQSGSGLLQ